MVRAALAISRTASIFIVNKRAFVAVALFAALVPLSAQRPAPPRTASPASGPFRVGEQLSYDITWSSFITATAATATVSVREKRAAYGSPLAYYLVAEGRPTPMLAMLYTLYYKADSWTDASTLLPLRASLYSVEGSRRENKVTVFDRARGTGRFEVQEGSRTSGRTVDLPPRTHDPLSAIFTLRASALSPGARMTMPMTYNGNLYQLQMTVVRREPLTTRLGTQQAWRVAPVLMEGGRPADSPRGMLLWISDDARRLPLKMQVEIPTGRFELTMTSAR